MSKGEMWVFDPSCITQLQSQITTDSIAQNCIAQHSTRSRRVVGLNCIWGSGFSEFPTSAINKIHFICVYHSHIRSLGWLVGRILDMLQCDCAIARDAVMSSAFSRYLTL